MRKQLFKIGMLFMGIGIVNSSKIKAEHKALMGKYPDILCPIWCLSNDEKNTLIVTAAHCKPPKAKFKVFYGPGLDIALARGPKDLPIQCFPQATAKDTANATEFFVPANKNNRLRVHRPLNSIPGPGADYLWAVLNFYAEPGDSGSPVLIQTKQGELRVVGMLIREGSYCKDDENYAVIYLLPNDIANLGITSSNSETIRGDDGFYLFQKGLKITSFGEQAAIYQKRCPNQDQINHVNWSWDKTTKSERSDKFFLSNEHGQSETCIGYSLSPNGTSSCESVALEGTSLKRESNPYPKKALEL
ncbi:MAG: hypothetical protein ISQ13_03235 [Candidatus Margulisbacteria bacterium]|nr:hypothetical protein [Candidatus Margulisiibacteriota bacterium]